MSWMIAASLGIIIGCYLPVLPPAFMLAPALVVIFPLFFGPFVLRVFAATALGLLWSIWVNGQTLQSSLPTTLSGQEFRIEGTIVGLPQLDTTGQKRKTRFWLDIDSKNTAKELHEGGWKGEGKVQLSWYGAPDLRTGQRWQLLVRLRSPRGFVNPGGFDYQAWLHRARLVATGYVRSSSDNRLITGKLQLRPDSFRFALKQRLLSLTEAHPMSGVLLALVIGDRSAIATKQWQRFARSGTTHLMVISGLHIGLVAGLCGFLGGGLSRLLVKPLDRLPAQIWGALAGLSAAALYTLLAGFSIPTQRALIMTAVAIVAICLRRHVRARDGFSCALLLVLLVDPMAPTSAGFWLSFSAVAVLLLVFNGRLKRISPVRSLALAQVVVCAGLFPVLVLQGMPASPSAPLINLLAVPWIGFVVVPLCLLGAALSIVVPVAAEPVLLLALTMLSFFDAALQVALNRLPDAIVLPFPAPSVMVVMMMAGGLLLMPRGTPGRPLVSLLLCLPFLASPHSTNGMLLQVLVLDVGQGLAVVVQGPQGTLVYDAGPKYSAQFDAGSGIVAPALRRMGVKEINVLLVSHSDNDHAGGLNGLLSAIPVGRIVSAEDVSPPSGSATKQCRAGQEWYFGEVLFEVLHPLEKQHNDNNGSCVLRISVSGVSFLLPGDIERDAELSLLQREQGRLQADVLIAPHHGSLTSSLPVFINAVKPKFVVFSAGHGNRFNHPNEKVVARYQRKERMLLSTAQNGAIEFSVDNQGRLLPPKRWRQDNSRFWYDQ